ncbi:MAG: serine hydrolase [Gemmatimonadota bacterium]|nr:serine hydrolase [Gemmatimonadota bacterium]
MRRFMCSATAVIGILVWAPSALSQATIGGEWRADVARFAQRVIDAGLAPGMAVAISKGDWVVWDEGFGVADASTGREVGEETIFYIASSTKALTATAVVLVAERGEIDLDAPASRYIPGLEFRDPLDADSVTIERLLTMTHGIDDGGPVVIRTAFTGQIDADTMVELLAGYGPSGNGNAFDYGNLGYNILGLALDPDEVHGWKDVVRREVIEPLGMASTTARLSTVDPDRIAMPHDIVPGEGYRRVRLAKADANLHAAGGHLTTARDLARFVAAHASGGLIEGERAFPADAILSTHAEHVDQDREFGPYRRVAWGYGWDIARWEGKTIVQRFGSFSGYRSHMSFEPESEIGVVVLVNGGGPASPAADLVASYAYDRLLGREDLEAEYDGRLAEMEQLAAGYEERIAEHLAERAARMAPLSHPLEAYAGTYESPALGRIVFRVVAEGLEAKAGVVRSRAEVYDAAEDQLRIVVGGGTVVDFAFPDDEGPADALVIAGARFERVAGP